MHTSAGNLPLPLVYVIHVAGPNATEFHDQDECHHLLRAAFRNCFKYANSTLNVHELAVPAISSGI